MVEHILKNIDDKECYYIGMNGCLYQDLTKEELLAIKQEIERLNNIIKEVREFAKLRKEMYERQENVVGQEAIISLLEILDKGE